VAITVELLETVKKQSCAVRGSKRKPVFLPSGIHGLAVQTGMNSMLTLVDVASSKDEAGIEASSATTWPPMSSNRAAGIVWSERLMAQVRVCSGDASRFAAGLGIG
jgi:hypothetical protein